MAAFATLGPGDLQVNVFFTHLGPANPVLLFAVARARGASAVEALGAGVFAALHPLLVRFSGEASSPSLVVFLGAAALLGLVAFRERRGAADLALYVVAGLLLAGTFAVWLVSDAFGDASHYVTRLRFHLPFWPPATVALNVNYTGLAAIATVVAGVWYGLREPGPSRAWTLAPVAAAVCVAWPVAIERHREAPVALARYHVGTLLPASLLAGLGLDRLSKLPAWRDLWARRRTAALLVLALGALSLVPPLVRDVELGFRPSVFRIAFTQELGFPTWRRWPEDEASAADGPRFFFSQAACSPSDDHRDAIDLRARCADALVPGRPYFRDHFSADPVPIGLYRMDGPALLHDAPGDREGAP